MPQDAYTLRYIAEELNEKLSGGKISKIAQPEKDLLSFIIYTRSGSVKLEICLAAKGCRINISDGELTSPKTAPAFCMLLRKHLQNAQITKIGQLGFERIVYIDFLCASEFELLKMRLYVEIMGKYSNAILTKDEIILGALKTTALFESVKRILFSGVKYAPPEKQDKIPPDDKKALEEVLKIPAGDRAKFIADRVLGISYATALDMVEEYGENPTADELNSYIFGGQSPCVTLSDGVPSDFKARSSSTSKIDFSTVLEAQSCYYSYVITKQIFSERKRKAESALLSAVKKCEKRLALIEDRLSECADAESVRLKGELITANIYKIPKGADGFEAENYYDEECKKIKIPLDKNLTPAENAQRYYKKYAKLKRTHAAASGQKKEAEIALNYLLSIKHSLAVAENTDDLKETEDELKALNLLKAPAEAKKREKETPFRAYEKDDFKIFAGRNNVSNDRLLKSVSPSDVWLHAKGYHSSHVVIVSDRRSVPDGVISTAAEICAYYSEGRGASKVPIDYCLKKFVKKPPKANAGFVIYTDYSTVLVQPDRHEELCVTS